MKKLKELSKQEIRKLYDKNEEFKQQCWQETYENNMYWQGHEAEELNTSVFDYHDHYYSFYLSTPTVYGGKSPEKVAGKLNKDYMTPENIKLYDELCKLNDKYDNLEHDDLYGELGESIYDDMIETCDKLADGLTEQLRAYEDVDEEQVLEELEFQRTDGYMADWETDGEKIYQTITKIYK